ncbi:ABC transporter ATP-binding protein [Paractinoplanes abujensis]|uniref:Putative ABC transport system ATP-binding protein n=1 Tax=Paractinoplanes abujensis TaxID=882441 RepID=A0A7W7G6I1_9ACTN|nr:ABC transporter ATP-binding protein [Actinoplanes abujensis]MBB4697450.1 putative ABC transport system ATP-binding protein [Actinoplanes abujensis]
MTTPMVAIKELRREYDAGPGPVTALDGVTVDLAAGTFTAVMGPSGSGKSTLLHCVAGLDRPTSGEVTIEGVRLGELDETGLTVLRRERIGFVFQAFNLISSLTAAQNVALPVRLAGRRIDPADVNAALDDVGLADRAHHRPVELSGGQQQRVAIARAMVTRPAVIFADEPTGALDNQTSRRVLELLRGLATGRGQTIVMVTHDPVAAAVADSVLLLADGRLVDRLDGASAEAIAARMTRAEATC